MLALLKLKLAYPPFSRYSDFWHVLLRGGIARPRASSTATLRPMLMTSAAAYWDKRNVVGPARGCPFQSHRLLSPRHDGPLQIGVSPMPCAALAVSISKRLLTVTSIRV